MLFGSKLRAAIFAVGLCSGAIACGGTEPPIPHAAPSIPGTVFSARASLTSQSTMGITRWHSTVGHGRADGTLAVDGQDAHGRVVFLATAYVDQKTRTVHVVSHLPQKGEFVFDLQHKKVLTNTLSGASTPYAKAMLADYAVAHPLHGAKAYAATPLGDIAGGAVRVVGGALIFGAGFISGNDALKEKGGALFEKGTEQIANGVEKLVDGAAGKDAAPAKEAVDQADQTVKDADPTTPAGDPPAADQPGMDGNTMAELPGMSAGSPDTNGTTPPADSTPAGDSPTGQPATGPTELPEATTGGNLDNVGDTAGSAVASGAAGATDPNQDATGGGAGGGGDTGGGDFAAGKCRQVARSKTSGVRACIHY